jgi:hypothetical protein
MLVSIKLFVIDGRDDEYVVTVKNAINEVVKRLDLRGNLVRFVSVRVNREFLDIIRSMILGGEGPAEFVPIVNELREYEIFDLPALVINGKKVFEGRALGPSEVSDLVIRRIMELIG